MGKDWTDAGEARLVHPQQQCPRNGKTGGRRVLLTADDFSLRSGHADGATAGKTIYLEKLALALKLPVVKLVDGSSGGGSVTTIRTAGWSYLPYVSMHQYVVDQLNQGIPNLGAVVGPAVGASSSSPSIASLTGIPVTGEADQQ